MRLRLKMVAAAALAAAPALLVSHGTGRAAEFIRKQMLVTSCTGHDAARVNDCEGYILGVADAAMTIPGSNGHPEVCIVAKVTGRAMREQVVAYLQGHPGPDGPAAPAVLDSLRALYKCGG